MSVLAASSLRGRVLAAALRQAAWLESFGPQSQDQYDFWSCAAGRKAKSLYYSGSLVGGLAAGPFVLLDALVPASRRLFWQPSRFAIADAHWAMGFYSLAKATGHNEWRKQGAGFLAHLLSARCPGFDEYCWGYPFDWETCFGTFPAGTPLITTIPYAYDAIEVGYDATGDHRLLEVMESVARFASSGIPYSATAPGARASAYTPRDNRRVVNASAYRARLLVDAGVRFGRREWIDEATEYAAFVLDTQQRDGSWLYAVDGKDAFVDNFHTCFVIKNLVRTAGTLEGDAFSQDLLGAAERGYSFYKRHLLDEHGQPVPFAKTQRPSLVRRELYDYAEGINLARLMQEIDADAERIGRNLLEVLLGDWQLADGHFVTRRTVFGGIASPTTDGPSPRSSTR